MNSGRYVLSQVLEHIHWQTLKRLRARYRTEARVRHFGCRQQLICMVFAQLTWREGLRLTLFLPSRRAGHFFPTYRRPAVSRIPRDFRV